ncbi:hypothetical protein [Clostridium thailandense]|uniref:hypothetical protein n=1 Tax=Clostridium thailandense TaxID=2794346 RepID=UPI0039890600
MKKKIGILMIFVLSVGILYYIRGRKVSVNIPIPNKIIVYKDGKSKTLTGDDENFNDIVELTNKRFNKSNSYNLEENSEYISYLYKNKLSWECLEFIYDKDRSFQLKIKNKNVEYKYKKLFFTIRAEESNDYGTNMAYGEK